MTPKIQLGRYDNSWYRPGRNILWRSAWLFVGQPLFACFFLPFSRLRVQILRLFGAVIGSGVVIHSGVHVKYPWHLAVGDSCWIGENAWIDNLTSVSLGNDVCVSQGVYFCTGNHDWTDPTFGLLIRPISLSDGAWAGAKSILLPGTRLEEGAILAAGGVASGTIPAFEIHIGNPAVFLRVRKIGNTEPATVLEMSVPQ